MKYTFLLFLSFSVFSQENLIKIIDYSSLKPINNVELFYKNKLIGRTDSLGVFKIKKNTTPTLLVKEDYYDTIINLENNTIKLKKIEGIKLNEVEIISLSDKSILDSIYKKIRKLENYKIPDNFHFKNFSKIKNDTICYINNIINFKKGLGFYTNSDNEIIKTFIRDKNTTIYKLNSNSITFNNDYLHINLPYYAMELQLVTKFQELFEYTIEKNEGLYKVNFKPNRKKSEFPYEGFIIVDALDFGIHEFKFTTSSNTKRNLIFENKIINFKVLNENGSLINKKNNEGLYELIQYSFFSKLEILNGFFKGEIFENNCYKETTIVESSDTNNSKKINFSTYNIE